MRGLQGPGREPAGPTGVMVKNICCTEDQMPSKVGCSGQIEGHCFVLVSQTKYWMLAAMQCIGCIAAGHCTDGIGLYQGVDGYWNMQGKDSGSCITCKHCCGYLT